jgi:hypothetical protein
MELRLRCEFWGPSGSAICSKRKGGSATPPSRTGRFFSYRLHEAGTLRCPLLALSGHALVHRTCLLSREERT